MRPSDFHRLFPHLEQESVPEEIRSSFVFCFVVAREDLGQHPKLKALSLFSGVGGLDLGFSRRGPQPKNVCNNIESQCKLSSNVSQKKLNLEDFADNGLRCFLKLISVSIQVHL